MNETAKKILLAGQKFIPELYLKQIGFAYSACGPSKKKKQRKNWKIYVDRKNRFYLQKLAQWRLLSAWYGL